MLDPIQNEALERARLGPIRVGGAPGTGRSHLAAAMAADAEARGLRCLLVGTSPVLDTAPPSTRRPGPDPILAARALAPRSPARAAPPEAPVPLDPLAARAFVDPDGATRALRLAEAARKLRARHGLTRADILATGDASAIPASAASLVTVAVEDARAVAAYAFPGKAVPSLSACLDLAGAGDAGKRLAATADEHEAYLRGIPVAGARPDAAAEGLRGALAGWGLDGRFGTVADAYGHALSNVRLARDTLAKLDGETDLAEVVGSLDPDGPEHRLLTLVANRPGTGVAGAATACRDHARRWRARAEALSPYARTAGAKALSDLRDNSADAVADADAGSRMAAARTARAAYGRLVATMGRLRVMLPPRVMDSVTRCPPEDAFRTLAAGQGGDRSRAARVLAEVAEAFAATGFGDVMDLPADFTERVVARDAFRALARVAGPTPEFLDLLLDPPGEVSVTGPWSGRVVRATAHDPLPSGRFDVVVIDGPGPGTDAFAALGDVAHLIGVDQGADVVLQVPHRQRDGVLADAATGPWVSPRWLGSPDAPGVAVIALRASDWPDLGEAVAVHAEALRSAGIRGVAAGADAAGEVVVTSVATCDDAAFRGAAGRASSGLVLLCREDSRTVPPDAPSGVSGPAGWRATSVTAEGTVWSKGGRALAVVAEGGWDGVGSTGVWDRVDRVRSLGWQPVVDWSGSPRGPDAWAELAESRSVIVGAGIRDVLARVAPPVAASAPAAPARVAPVPATPAARPAVVASPAAAHPALPPRATGMAPHGTAEPPATSRTVPQGRKTASSWSDRTFTERLLSFDVVPGMAHARVLKQAEDLLVAEMARPDAVPFLSNVAFARTCEDRVYEAIQHVSASGLGTRAGIGSDEVHGESPGMKAYAALDSHAPLLTVWAMTRAISTEYRVGHENAQATNAVWRIALKAIGIEDRTGMQSLHGDISVRMNAALAKVGVSLLPDDRQRHVSKLFMAGGIPREMFDTLAMAFGSAGAGDARTRLDKAASILSSQPRVARVLALPQSLAYLGAYDRMAAGREPRSTVESQFLDVLSPRRSTSRVSTVGRGFSFTPRANWSPGRPVPASRPSEEREPERVPFAP